MLRGRQKTLEERKSSNAVQKLKWLRSVPQQEVGSVLVSVCLMGMKLESVLQ